MTEEQTSNSSHPILEENIIRLKGCLDFLSESYNSLSDKTKNIKENSEENNTSTIESIFSNIENVCTEVCDKIKLIKKSLKTRSSQEDTVINAEPTVVIPEEIIVPEVSNTNLKDTSNIIQNGMSTETTAVNVNSTETDAVNVNSTETVAVNVNSTETAAVNVNSTETTAVNVNSTETAAVNVNCTETAAVNVNCTETAAVNVNCTETTAVNVNSTETTNTRRSSSPAENQNIENFESTEKVQTVNDDPPKLKIRLVALEKLLDPKLARKHAANVLDDSRSVIILDSDNDEPPVTTVKSNKRPKVSVPAPKTSEKNINISAPKTNQKNIKNPPSVAPIEKDNSKLKKRVAVRVKRNKLIEKLLKENKTHTRIRNTERTKSSSTKSYSSKLSESKSIKSGNMNQTRRPRNAKKQVSIVDISDSSSSDESSSRKQQTNRHRRKKNVVNSDSDDVEIFKLKNNKKLKKDESSSEKEKKDSEQDSSSNESAGNKDKDKSDLSEKEKSGSDKDSSSDSDIIRKKRAPIKKRDDSSKSGSNDDDNDDDDDGKKSDAKKSKRKRIRTESNSDSDNSENDSPNKKRKNIRKLIKTKNLESVTKRAAREEEERKKRIEERQKLYNKIYEEPESVELKKLVLDFNEETNEELLTVDSGLLKQLKPHQATGVKFMWDACFETLSDANDKPGSGCILAHCMGLGKTLQVVALTHTLITHSEKTNVQRVLIITPLSTLTNWAREYHTWIRYCKNKNVEIYDMSKWRDKQQRVFKLNEWFEEGGVCIIGYDMYRILANPTAARTKKKIREQLQRSLIDPGPDMVVCDEGHLLKNEKTSISQAVSKIRTQRRIVLTGTPLQNNLKEYYCMIQFVKPNLLGTYKEYMNRFVNPIMNGQYTDSTERDTRLMKNRSHVLHKLLEGCIQRKDYSVLSPYLPPKYEFSIFIQLTELQVRLYQYYMETHKPMMNAANSKGAVLFQDFQSLKLIWTHPMCLRISSRNALKRKMAKEDTESEGSLKDFIDDDDDSSSGSSSSSKSDNDEDDDDDDGTSKNQKGSSSKKSLRRTRQNAEDFDDTVDPEALEVKADDPTEWWSSICTEEDLIDINNSSKLLLLMQILKECDEIGDKVLVFSQSLQSLDVIEQFLSVIDKKTQQEECEGNVNDFSGSWSLGLDYFRLDGSSSVEQREYMCKTFNNDKNLRIRLFLISTRAGGLGINLFAANRVIIFDVSWNPSHDTQSIFRVYRFGQKKPSYIYRFIAMGTMEEKVYERQVAKQATAKRVIDEQQIGRHYNQNDLLELYKYDLVPSTPREIPNLPKDRLFAELLGKYEKLIYKYHEHDSLLENEESENLNEEERKAAWADYEAEKNRPPQVFASYPRQTYNTNGPATSNKIFGFRTDVLLRLLNMKIAQEHPMFTEGQVIQMVPLMLQQLYAQMNVGDTTLYKQLIDLNAFLAANYVNPAGNMRLNPFSAAYTINQQPQDMGMQQAGNSTEFYEID